MSTERNFIENCALSCGLCPKHRTHYCRKCHMEQENCGDGVFRIHRSGQCIGSGPECTVCGAKGTHDKNNCPNRQRLFSRCLDYLINARKLHPGFAAEIADERFKQYSSSTSRHQVLSGSQSSTFRPQVLSGSQSSTFRPQVLSGSQSSTFRPQVLSTPRLFTSSNQRFVRKSDSNGRDITSGTSITITFTKMDDKTFIFVHGDQVGRGTPKKYGFIMSSGGGIKRNALESADAEDREEQGACGNLPYQYYASDGDFHYFIVCCSPDTYCKRVTTPEEIMPDPEHIKNSIPDGVMFQTQVPTTWGVDLNALLHPKNKSTVYPPFRKALFTLRTDDVFN